MQQNCNHTWYQPQDAWQPECNKCGLMKSTVQKLEAELNSDSLEKRFYRNGYLNALQDTKEIIRKQWDEEWIDYANPLPDIIKIIESLENEKRQ